VTSPAADAAPAPEPIVYPALQDALPLFLDVQVKAGTIRQSTGRSYKPTVFGRWSLVVGRGLVTEWTMSGNR